MHAYRDWLQRHPMDREAWEIVRIGRRYRTTAACSGRAVPQRRTLRVTPGTVVGWKGTPVTTGPGDVQSLHTDRRNSSCGPSGVKVRRQPVFWLS